MYPDHATRPERAGIPVCCIPSCDELAARGHEHCLGHVQLIWRFGLWLDASPTGEAPSLDRDRLLYERGARFY